MPRPTSTSSPPRSDRERESALKHTLKTLEFATRVKAPLVVLHLGSVEMKDYTGKLKELLERGEKDSPKYEKLAPKLIEKREAKKEKFVERLYDIAPQNPSRGRSARPQARRAKTARRWRKSRSRATSPSCSANSPVRSMTYWHDTGHAQIKENLGFIQHAHAPRDRLPTGSPASTSTTCSRPRATTVRPAAARVDFAALKPFVKPQHIKVFEFSPAMPVEEVKRGVAHVKRIWGDLNLRSAT